MSVTESINHAVVEFDKVIGHLVDGFSRLQVGRASPALVENILIDLYGSSQPIKAVASISIPEPRSLVIQPWDKGALAAIEKGIVAMGIGLNPINDGLLIRINIPPLTEERRTELTKHVKKLAEDARISVRNVRQDAHNRFKQLKSDSEITEDDLHSADKKLQDKVEEFNKKIDELAQTKEKEVMTI